MRAKKWDVVIIGGGAAGLAAANALARQGLKTLVLEARNRLGGRILTQHDPLSAIPIELGAEFIHGMPDELWDIARLGELSVYDIPDLHFYSTGEEIVRMSHFWEDIGFVIRRIKGTDGRDQSLARFLEGAARDHGIARFLPLVRGYVEGFHGADPRFMSERALYEAEESLSKPLERKAFRFAGGYDQVIRWLATAAKAADAEIALNTVAYEVSWRRGSAEISIRSSGGFALPALYAHQVLVAIPLGLLQASVHENPIEGAIRFSPPIKEKEHACARLRVGPVAKMILSFRSRFWEETPSRLKSSQDPWKEFGFLHHAFDRAIAFSTWWSSLPIRSAVLTGWSGGPKALEVTDRSPEAVLDEALNSLSVVSGFGRKLIEGELQGWSYHDWQRDPFSRGAYSYVGVGGTRLQKDLARPIQETLFFAGEATHYGQSGTVDGAIASGQRAAREILQAAFPLLRAG